MPGSGVRVPHNPLTKVSPDHHRLIMTLPVDSFKLRLR